MLRNRILGTTFLVRDGALQALRLAKVLATCRQGHHKIFRVRGRSMCPTLVPGDYVVIDARSSEAIELGAIVVARLPEDDTVVIKRLRSRGDYTVFLGSDDPNVGRDSRHFGSLPGGSVVGEVILHLGTSRIGAAWRSRAAL